MFQDKFSKAYKKIKRANNILLVTHNRPDGDALSSVCAMIEFIESINKKYYAYCLDKPPIQYNFLPHIEKISYIRTLFNFSEYDLVIVLDCGSLSRTNLVREITNRKTEQFIIELDHHPRIDNYADLEIRIPEYSSTAEVLYFFFKNNHLKINKKIANCILAGILTDTGNFLYPSTSDQTVKIASQMLVLGARFPTILENTSRNKTLPAMKLWGIALNRLKINPKYNTAFSVLTREDFLETKSTEEELEGIPGFLTNLEGVNALLFLRQLSDGKIKGSLRTAKPNVDVSRLAQLLGGGGHPKASAFIIDGQLEKTDSGWQII
jgi:phosphoesterase RecJ-like protein